PARDAEDSARFEEAGHGGAGQVFGKHDAIVNLDAIGINRQIQILNRLKHETNADVPGFLRLQWLRAESKRGGAVCCEGAHFVRNSAGEGCRCRLEILLGKRWRSESVGDGAAQRYGVAERISCGKLTGTRAA